MKTYLTLLDHLLTKGKDRSDRTGTGTRGVFGYQARFNLEEGFPLLTTKKTHFRSIVHELIWFLSGSGNIKYLKDNKVTIWDKWADANGDLGPVYGVQWRHWPKDATFHKVGHPCYEVDQIKQLISDLKTNPFSRRHIVTAWNPPQIPEMKLPPCHTMWQCYVEDVWESDCDCCYGTGLRQIPETAPCNCGKKRLSLELYMRSCDSFLGLPFNIASYALLLSALAVVLDMEPGDLVISFGDLHLYKNHFDQAKLQLSREPKELPRLFVAKHDNIDAFRFEDFMIEGYDPHPAIAAPISV